ncbi:hypothetical protein Tco_0817222 [Tanacetum coccineum]
MKTSPHATLKPDKGKGKATNTNESPKKLVNASTEVRPDLDAPMLIPFEINAKEKVSQEAKLLALSKPDLIKVVHEEATKAGVDTKALASKKGGQKFGDFGVTKWDELDPIIQKKKNKVGGELMIFLRIKYDRLKVIPEELGINPTLHAPGQILSLTLGRKRKPQELEPETHIPELECNRILPEEILFVNKLALLTYLVMALSISTPANQWFCAALRNLIDSHPNKEKLKSKKVKLEAVGYSLK